MTSCSGLPICLSGIQIFPQQVRSQMRSWPRTPPISPACLAEGECAGSDCESTSPANRPVSGMIRDNGGSHERRNSEIETNMSEWPRLALAQQMADLDCRREAVRRRSLHNSSFLVDYRLSRRQNDMLAACLESQSRLQEEDSACTPKNVVAKAA
eukprot:c33652_g1_i1 orf=281-745(-)